MPASTFVEILKFNPYHDSKGRFASAGNAASFTYAPGKSKAHDNAIAREQERQSSAGGDNTKAQMDAVHKVEDKIRHQFYESAAVVDSDGKILFRKDGAIGEVGFSKEEAAMLKGNTVTHNHPDDAMLSVADINCFMKYDIQELRATTKDGTTYSIKRGENYTADRAQRFVIDYDGEMKAARLTADKQTFKKYYEKVMDGEMTQEQYDYEHTKVVSKEMVSYCQKKAASYNIEFSVEKRDVKPSSTFEVYTGKSDVTPVAKTFEEILKFNPYHDSKGRFTTAGGATSFTYKPGQGAMYDNAIAREKERTGHAGGSAAGKQTDGEDSAATPREKAIRAVEDKIRNQDYESAAIIDRNGKEILFKDGQESQVAFSFFECRMMQDNTLTHNHPRCSMFSYEDLSCFAAHNMQEIRATNRDGVTYSMSRGKNYTLKQANEFSKAYRTEYSKATSHAQADLDKRGFAEKIMNGEITHAYANREFAKSAAKYMVDYCEKNAGTYGLNFKVESVSVGAKKSLDTQKELTKAMADVVLDKDTEAMLDNAFNDWLEQNGVPKDEPAEKSFNIYKTDDDKRLVFGWASVSITLNGEQLEDRQEDMIDPEDLEEAAYEYVLNFRDTGEEHIPTMRKKGRLVESCVFTAEKQKAMGIPEGTLPIAWWIGFKIEDDAAWERVKNGTYKMFSIEGRANREPVTKSDDKPIAKTFNDIMSREFP